MRKRRKQTPNEVRRWVKYIDYWRARSDEESPSEFFRESAYFFNTEDDDAIVLRRLAREGKLVPEEIGYYEPNTCGEGWGDITLYANSCK